MRTLLLSDALLCCLTLINLLSVRSALFTILFCIDSLFFLQVWIMCFYTRMCSFEKISSYSVYIIISYKAESTYCSFEKISSYSVYHHTQHTHRVRIFVSHRERVYTQIGKNPNFDKKPARISRISFVVCCVERTFHHNMASFTYLYIYTVLYSLCVTAAKKVCVSRGIICIMLERSRAPAICNDM